MQSIKNTTVTILLLFLSFGVYQVVMKPVPSDRFDDEFSPLAINDPLDPTRDDESSNNASNGFANGFESDAIPPQLLETPALPQSSRPQSSQSQSSFSGLDKRSSFPDLGPPPQPSGNNTPFASSSQSEFSPAYPIDDPQSTSASSTFVGDRDSAPMQQNSDFQPTESGHALTSQLNSDAQVKPITVMGNIAPKPSLNNNESNDSQLATPAAKSTPPATLTETWPMVTDLVRNARYQDALLQLSKHYHEDNLPADQRQQLLDWLDALATKVIYSSEHHLRSLPYIIQPGDTIAELARKWQVPAQLIYNVNQAKIPDPNDLQAGVEIKLIQGPFDAEIDSTAGQMTLFLDQLYAGRFVVRTGAALPDGEFTIVDKTAQGRTGQPFWISLNNGMSISASTGAPPQNGDIALNRQEAEEVFSILSAASKIRVLR